MEKSFIDDLEYRIKMTDEKYTEAKQEVIKSMSDNMYTHVDFGAAYASHIDNVTKYASEIKLLYEIKDMYNYYNKK